MFFFYDSISSPLPERAITNSSIIRIALKIGIKHNIFGNISIIPSVANDDPLSYQERTICNLNYCFVHDIPQFKITYIGRSDVTSPTDLNSSIFNLDFISLCPDWILVIRTLMYHFLLEMFMPHFFILLKEWLLGFLQFCFGWRVTSKTHFYCGPLWRRFFI